MVGLPKNASIQIPHEGIANQLRAVAINEMENGVTLYDQEVVVVSKTYILERDERELELIKEIERLKTKYER